MKKQQYKYQAFISYRHADNKEQGRIWATWLHQAIETYEVPLDLVGKTNSQGVEIPARIYPVFRDEEELPADANLGTAIIKALDETQLLIVLCSPRAVQSTYVADEIDYFKKLNRSDKIIAAMIDGEPNTIWDKGKQADGFNSDDECFPVPLQFEYDTQGNRTSKHVEPLAADFRINNNGKTEQGWTSIEAYRQHLKSTTDFTSKEIQAKLDAYQKQQNLMLLKIIAGILGLPLGDLTQRDKAYQLDKSNQKAKILKRWLMAVFMLSIVAISIGYYAFKQKSKAEIMLQSVRENISFMNIDLQDILKQHVPINKRYKVTNHIDQLLKQLQTGDSTSEEDQYALFLALMNKIEVLNQNVETNVTESLPLATQALEIISTLTSQYPSQLKYKSDKNKIYQFLGDIYYNSGSPDLALQTAEQALKVAKLTVKNYPEEDRFSFQLAESYSNYGIVLDNKKESLIAYQASLSIIKSIINHDPNSIEYQLLHMKLYMIIADRKLDEEEHDENALGSYKKALDIALSLKQSHPNNEEIKFHLGIIYNSIGYLHDMKEETEDAIKYYLQAVEIYKFLIRKDPSNINYQRQLVSSNNNIGGAYSMNGNNELSLHSYLKSLNMDIDLATKYPNNMKFQSDLGIDYIRVGVTQLRLNQLDEALNTYRSFLDTFVVLTNKYPNNTDFQYRLSGAYNRIGNVHSKLGQPQLAIESYNKSIKVDTMLVKKHPKRITHTEDLSETYNNLGTILLREGSYMEALTVYNIILDLKKLILEAKPESLHHKNQFWDAYNKMGRVHLRLGKYNTALNVFNEGLKIVKQLVEDSPDNTYYQLELSITLQQIAKSQLFLIRYKQALNTINESLAIMKNLDNNESFETYNKLVKSWSLKILADIETKLQKTDQALKDYLSSIALIKSLLKEKLNNDDYKEEYKRDLANAYKALSLLFTTKNQPKESLNYIKKARDTWISMNSKTISFEDKENLKSANKLISVLTQ